MKLKRFIGFFLLLVFALSATPKKVLHDWFADHVDSYAYSASGLVVSKDGFNCDTQDEVVSSPFISIEQGSQPFPSELLPLLPEASYSFNLLRSHSAKDSRGPPSAC